MDLERPEWLVQMEGILETLNEGVLIADDCHHIIFVNDCFARMCGYSVADLLGRSPFHFYPNDAHDFLNKQIAQSEQIGHNRFEFFLPQKDGGRLPVVIGSRVLEDPDGRIFSVVTFTDIFEQKQAEARLKEANAQLEQRQKEIEEELALAARVQQSLTPQGLQWGRVGVEAFYLPVRTIGGDFGLVRPSGDRHLNLLVCDVSGHGISSALVANRIYSELMVQMDRGAPIGEMLRSLNRFVLQHLGGPVFYFSLAAAQVKEGGRQMTFVGAGHPPAMVVAANGGVRLLESRNMVLGLLEGAVAEDGGTQEVELGAGDRVVLYTDGLTEVFDQKGEMLDVDGLQAIVRKSAKLPLAEMKQAILDGIAKWRYGPPADDMSLVLVEAG